MMNTSPHQILIFILVLKHVVSEYFTSLSHMKALFTLEQQLTLKLEQAINEHRETLKELEDMYTMTSIAHQNHNSEYISNPTNSYLLIKRFVKLWPHLRDILSSKQEKKEDLVSALHEHSSQFPAQDDIEGAREALIRLQETFLLQPKDIVSGFNVNSKFTNNLLEFDDTYDIAMQAYNRNKKTLSHAWFSHTLSMLDDVSTDKGVGRKERKSRFEVLDYMAWIEYLTNDFDAAYKHTLEMVHLEPSNRRIQNNLIIFNRTRHEKNSMNQAKHASKRKVKYKKFYYGANESEMQRYPVEIQRMRELCRGETDPIPKRHRKKLLCWMKTDHPRLRIQPALVERVYIKPEILIFRRVLTNRDIDRVKELALPHLERATVHNPATGKLEFADYRTSKSAWLDEEDDQIVITMNQRIEAYTGLDMQTAEKLQVANYGIGGHYEVHFDFARTVKLRPPPWKNRTDYVYRVHSEEPKLIRATGNRIATFLLYMSDVVRGGSTVFTNIGQAVKPSKGDAVFWYNLHHDGSGDPDTRHAACPVLIGEKWVSNRWIHERGQEFRRKCRLKPEHDYI